ncbi:hypothetical protein [Roseivirga sp.]|uniref:hypothetical protein n=1 Tax=Roseivirga sp. TaxID=1964215 RepID=UPI003B8B9549
MVKALNPFVKDVRSGRVFTYGIPLAPYKEGLIYHRTMSDTIFYLNQNTLSPLITYDFGADWAWTNAALIANDASIRSITMKNDYVWNTNSYVGDEFILMRFTGGRKDFRYILIDRIGTGNNLIDFRKGVDENFDLRPIRWDNNFLTFSLSSSDVSSFVEELGLDKVSYRKGTTLESIEDSENPALIRIKFKMN